MENEIRRGRKKKEIDGIFAERLSGLLQAVKSEKGIIQEDVAKATGITRQSLGKWANGENVPDILDLKKLAEYFGVSADYLLGLTDNSTTDMELQAVCNYTGLSDNTIYLLNLLNQVRKLNISDYQPSIINILDSIFSEIDNGYYYFLFFMRDAINTNLSEDDSDLVKIIKSVDLSNSNVYILLGQNYSDYLMQKCNKYVEQLNNKVVSTLRGDSQFDKELNMNTLTKVCERIINSYNVLQEVIENGEHNPPEE